MGTSALPSLDPQHLDGWLMKPGTVQGAATYIRSQWRIWGAGAVWNLSDKTCDGIARGHNKPLTKQFICPWDAAVEAARIDGLCR